LISDISYAVYYPEFIILLIIDSLIQLIIPTNLLPIKLGNIFLKIGIPLENFEKFIADDWTRREIAI